MRNIFFPHYLSGEPFRDSRNLIGIFLLRFHRNSGLCNMETNQLEVLARLVLPSEILILLV